MTASTKTPEAPPAPLLPGAASADRYSGLREALEQLTRTLSVAASRPVSVTDPRVAQVSPAALAGTDTTWFGTHGAVVGVHAAGAHTLAELVLGLTPDPAPRPLSPVETRLLRADLVPMLAPVTAALSDTPGTDLTGLAGDAALTALGRRSVLTTLTVTVRATAQGRTVSSEVVIAVATDPRSNVPAGPVDLDHLTGPLADIPLAVRVTLPPTLVPAHTLAALTPGAQLPLSATAETPWLLWANDTLVAAGAIGKSRNRRSVHLNMTWRQHPMSEQVLAGLAAAQQAVDNSATEQADTHPGLGLLGTVRVEVTAVLGKVTMPLREVAALHPGQVIELDRAADAPFTIEVEGVPYATAEVVLVDGHVGLQILELVRT